MSTNELQPCPECGGAAVMQGACRDYWVMCTACKKNSEAWTFESEARVAWNARAPQPQFTPSTPVGLERKFPDDGNGDDDAYNRGWNDCLDARPTGLCERTLEAAAKVFVWQEGSELVTEVDGRVFRARTHFGLDSQLSDAGAPAPRNLYYVDGPDYETQQPGTAGG